MAALVKMIFPEKKSHKKYRASLKKQKRKKRRQELARLRDSEWLKTEEEEEAFIEKQGEEELLDTERQNLHEEWLLREQKAQEEFKIKKEKEEAARKQQEEQEERKMKELEEQLRKEREEEEQKLQEKRKREMENSDTWQNPEPPTNLRSMEKDQAICPFYSKTGACRFGDRCSRKHNYPATSSTLLIKSMFTTFEMEQCSRDDYDPDASLEYSEEETYQQFLDFYDDVLPEFKNVGKVIQFKVSCNLEPHLRGNVYVQYQLEEECQAALSLFNGRWYAGRQLQCEFCPVTQWKTAICGLFEVQQCPRGNHCNFLHVFRNPNNELWEANRDMSPGWTNSSFSNNLEKKERIIYYGKYYGKPRRRSNPSPDHFYKRNREPARKRRSNHMAKKSQEYITKSDERPNSQSGGRKGAPSHNSRSHLRRTQSQSWSGSKSHCSRCSDSRDHTIQRLKFK
ncbi:U2 small nuclear ribonucleoprotein auxiliary factor 35 kDa subunit-related protein 2-like isoform X1 [Marmota marmota marmota]|uniref:U2 small nuclear ribonucleoprotein auxiliary factor 35 kDa subunit-related protein 2-like isoform X1 n=1 Tax=Marmota marmota marmota TaxID=9994 RepID=UPI002093D508|nr:U2 small nuclear ribonucleoprotein auxiliary factor 35 kDa subunit-related protein 2-like isoform X1 [Marmota marmota marmota]